MKVNRPLSAGLAVVVIGLVVLIVAVSGGSAGTAPKLPGASAVSVAQTPLGQSLVDANGRTLYLFAADKPGVRTLSQAGLEVWPAFTATATPQAEGAIKAKLVSTIAGPGGKLQVTYNGHPLYYYVGDQKPRDARGQGLNRFGALWYVLSPGGSAVTKSVSTAATQPAQPAGGYSSGY